MDAIEDVTQLQDFLTTVKNTVAQSPGTPMNPDVLQAFPGASATWNLRAFGAASRLKRRVRLSLPPRCPDLLDFSFMQPQPAYAESVEERGVIGLANGDNLPVFVPPEIREREPIWNLQSVLVLRGSRQADQDSEQYHNGCNRQHDFYSSSLALLYQFWRPYFSYLIPCHGSRLRYHLRVNFSGTRSVAYAAHRKCR